MVNYEDGLVGQFEELDKHIQGSDSIPKLHIKKHGTHSEEMVCIKRKRLQKMYDDCIASDERLGIDSHSTYILSTLLKQGSTEGATP